VYISVLIKKQEYSSELSGSLLFLNICSIIAMIFGFEEAAKFSLVVSRKNGNYCVQADQYRGGLT